MSETPNILFVIMDCVRAQNTSLHSYERETTPFLEEFTQSATLFEQARAPSPMSLTSHISMFTSLHVEEHNVISRDYRIEPGLSVWENIADEYNYDTGVFSENIFLTELDVGLKSSFDHVYSGSELPYENGLNPSDYHDGNDFSHLGFLIDSLKDWSLFRSSVNVLSKKWSNLKGRQYIDKFLSWKGAVEGPWAGVINLMDAHTNYEPPKTSDAWSDEGGKSLMSEIDDAVWEFQCGYRPYSELNQLEDLYDGCIHYVDQQISRLVQNLKQANEFENTLIIITADHGEGFGERSRIRPNTKLAGHGESKVHESIIHVPLVVKFPHQSKPIEVEEPVSLTYLPSLISSVIEGKDYKNFVNKSPVISTAVGLQDRGYDRAQIYCNGLDKYTGFSRALYQKNREAIHKYMSWKSEERVVTVSGHSEIPFKELEVSTTISEALQQLDDRDVAIEVEDDVSEEVYQRLRRLGYA